MRQREICKHQVCNHCGGRFGMVTHRWWGNKFCKRRCKNAYPPRKSPHPVRLGGFPRDGTDGEWKIAGRDAILTMKDGGS
jgi:hypothetical protein